MTEKPNADWTRDNSPKHWWQWPGIIELLIAAGVTVAFLGGYALLYLAVWGVWPTWA